MRLNHSYSVTVRCIMTWQNRPRFHWPSNVPAACLLFLWLSAGAALAAEEKKPAAFDTTKYLDAFKALAAARAKNLPANPEFKATAEEMNRAMRAETAAAQKGPLQFSKGNGVRLLMTGHSWVAPACRTLPSIAAAAGYDGHHQRAHISGGSTGSANSIWLTEFGKFRNKPATPVLLPAIATGQWDVMSWGAFFGDTPECYTQWIDVCLKHNPQMTFLLQDGWPMYPRELPGATAEEKRAVIDAQQSLAQEAMFRGLYDALEKRNPGKVRIIPAGAAVVEMLHHYFAGKLTGFDCVSEHLGGKRGIYRDGGHLSAAGGMEHLVGYVYFGMLYRRSPAQITNYHPAGVDPAVDRLMREAAWKAIIESPFSGITDRTGQGKAD